MSHRVITDVSTPAFVALYAWWMMLLVAYGLLALAAASEAGMRDADLMRGGPPT